MNIPTLLAAAIALTTLAPLSTPARADGFIDNRTLSKLYRAGSRNGNYCATYVGVNGLPQGRLTPLSFSRSACFDTMRACKSWFYDVQSAFGTQKLRRPCKRVG